MGTRLGDHMLVIESTHHSKEDVLIDVEETMCQDQLASICSWRFLSPPEALLYAHQRSWDWCVEWYSDHCLAKEILTKTLYTMHGLCPHFYFCCSLVCESIILVGLFSPKRFTACAIAKSPSISPRPIGLPCHCHFCFVLRHDVSNGALNGAPVTMVILSFQFRHFAGKFARSFASPLSSIRY